MNGKNKKQKFCPFINDNYEDCYCNELNSQNIETVIYYCGNNYRICKLYKKYSEKLKKNREVCKSYE